MANITFHQGGVCLSDYCNIYYEIIFIIDCQLVTNSFHTMAKTAGGLRAEWVQCCFPGVMSKMMRDGDIHLTVSFDTRHSTKY